MSLELSNMFINYAMIKAVLDSNIKWERLPELELSTYISEVLDDEEINNEVKYYQQYQRQPDGHDDFVRGVHIGARIVAKIVNGAYHEYKTGTKIEHVYSDMMEGYFCDTCKKSVGYSDRYCRHCGTRFDRMITIKDFDTKD